MAEMTPMMRQYLAVKAQHKDDILFFRLGDFYEMFFDDAKTASRELELTLTGKDCGMKERAPMCGIPYHSCEGYIARLVQKGYKVAICEQTEDPALAKGLVKRDILRVITPGTVIESSMLDEGRNNYLSCVYADDTGAGMCFADVSTGEVHVTQFAAEAAAAPIGDMIIDELGRFVPSEIILGGAAAAMKDVCAFLKDRIKCTVNTPDAEDFAPRPQELMERFRLGSLSQAGLEGKPLALSALSGLLRYLERTQMSGLERINTVYYYTGEQYMKLDLSTRRNLELVETMRGREKRGTLLWVLDKTRTAMGRRLIRSYIEQPLMNIAEITRRHNAVSELAGDTMLRTDLAQSLDGIYDLERLMTRIVYGSANGRELRSLSQTAEKLPGIKKRLEGVGSQLLRDIYSAIDPLGDIYSLIDSAIAEDPPLLLREGGIIRAGYNAQVDELRDIMSGGKGYLAKIEAEERERSGIKNLKIGYNKVFGYYIEITKSNIGDVPENYIRKQTLTNCERYITPELKELEGRVLGAQERAVQLEYELFDGVRRSIAEQLHRIQTTARALAALDVMCSFAQAAVENDYCRPDMSLDGRIAIKDGRHPVVEAMLSGVPFVPNDTTLNNGDDRVAIITGPNMAGKSTYMRQVALICLMAQTGSFVPARSAQLGLVDSIFTRVGASDDLASGQSTFMVEMSEVANILSNATADSLLVFDEIGRGTSTFDGMSIARAVLEYVADKKTLGAKTLFATHYHELTELEGQLPGVKNYNIAVKKHGDEITFLRRIIRGGTDSSYGIDVARLAGIPDKVVARARRILS
jgi:DNA mismatch repair protein MutS